MTLQYFIWIIIYAVVVQLSFIMLVYLLLKAKKSALFYSFIFVHMLTIIWVLRSLVLVVVISFIKDTNQLLVINDILNLKIGSSFGGLIGLAWLIFSLNYVNSKYSKSRYMIMLLSIPVIIYLILALTNNRHHLLYNDFEPGPAFYIYTFAAYLYAVAGFITLIAYAVKQRGHEMKRTALLVFAYLIPFASCLTDEIRMNILHVRPFFGYFDVTPIFFSVGIVFIAIIISRYKFLNVKTIALNRIVDNLKQSVVIVDSNNRIISLNSSFIREFTNGKQTWLNENISVFCKYLQDRLGDGIKKDKILQIINSNGSMRFIGELKLVRPAVKYYDVMIQSIMENGKNFGRVISFDDNTRMKEFTSELEEKNETLSVLNRELVEKNMQLRNYASTVEELTVIKERDRLSRDVHDTLGHTMAVLITQLKVAGILCETEPGKAANKIKDMLITAKEGLNELRKSISGLTPGKLLGNNLENAVGRLIADFEAADMKIDLAISGTTKNIPVEYNHTIFRICQEALTNSLRHGRAKHADVVFNIADGRIKILIKDDGCGCADIKKGYGLTGMEERVLSLDGRIQYGSDGEDGFNIFVELP